MISQHSVSDLDAKNKFEDIRDDYLSWTLTRALESGIQPTHPLMSQVCISDALMCSFSLSLSLHLGVL